MSTEFHPDNAIVKCCMQGMKLEEEGKFEEAGLVFLQAWDTAAGDFESSLLPGFWPGRSLLFPGKFCGMKGLWSWHPG